MNNKRSLFLTDLGISLLVFTLVLVFFRPGYWDVKTPFHSDLYRYALVSEASWSWKSWLLPRPLMIAYLKAVSVFGRDYLFIFLTLPAIAFSSMALFAWRHLSGHGLSVGGATAYCFVIFASPAFYPLYQYDYAGMLAGALTCVLAVSAAPLATARLSGRTWCLLFMSAAIFWVSIEVKPTYPVAVILVLLCLKRKFSDWRVWGGLSALLLFVAAAVVVKDVSLGSPFVGLSSSANPYLVKIDVFRNIQLFLIYAKSILGGFFGVLLIVALAVLFAEKKFNVIVVAIVLAVGSLIPICLLVNREWSDYAWYALPSIAIIVATSLDILCNLISRLDGVAKFSGRGIAVLFSSFIMVALLFAYGSRAAVQTQWASDNQRYNKNILNLIEFVRNPSPGNRNIIVGVHGPYHALRNTAYAASVNGALRKTDVALIASESAWNGSGSELTNGVNYSSVNFEDYEQVYIVGSEGDWVGGTSGEVVSRIPKGVRAAFLLCNTFAEKPRVPDDDALLAKAIECLNNYGQYSEAASLSKEAFETKDVKFSWAYYQYARAQAELGAREEALFGINRAIALEPNNIVFTNFKESLKK